MRVVQRRERIEMRKQMMIDDLSQGRDNVERGDARMFHRPFLLI